MGRPTVMTDDIIKKLEEAFAWGCSDNEACLWADIAPATLYKYQENNKDFTERKTQLKETPVMKARKSVIDGFKSDPKLALAFLERKKRDEFSLKTEQDIRVQEVIPILNGLSKETGNGLLINDSDQKAIEA